MKAYLDIETSFAGEITVIGVFIPPTKLIQLIGEEVNWSNIWNALTGVSSLRTYNGSRFDLPVIKRVLKLDLAKYFECRDLMYDCWQKNLYGGLKRVEEQLGIERETRGIDGLEAMRLWERYRLFNDQEALQLLLSYNREDVINLYYLEAYLEGTFSPKG